MNILPTRRSMPLRAWLGLVCGAALLLTAPRESIAEPDLASLGLEALMNIEVTSVAKREQKVSQAPAAIHVINREDIRRSGATSIPELLRNVPGLQVAKLNSSRWAISSRGGNSEFANKMLVLIDGRTIYTPVFSGVYWDAHDTALEDIDRIEVVRGPGGALWGANAVNGVINIITKHSKNSQGFLFSAGMGTEDRAIDTVRYGGALSDDTTYRLYAKYANRGSSEMESLTGREDDWQNLLGGFRFDSRLSSRDSLTVQGDANHSDQNAELIVPSFEPPFASALAKQTDVTGANLLARWTRTLTDDSELSLQTYVDRSNREKLVVDQHITTWDTDFQHLLPTWGAHHLMYGAGFRLLSDELNTVEIASFDPRTRNLTTSSFFLQDEIALIRNELSLTLGSKFEHNDFSGWEIQPNARVGWTPSDSQTVWAAVSRAARTSSRYENDINGSFGVAPLTGGAIGEFVLRGRTDQEAENLTAYEVGYRVQPSRELSFDLASFYNEYSDVAGFAVRPPEVSFDPFPHPLIPIELTNDRSQHSAGGEALVTWAVTPRWRLQSGYSYVHVSATEGDSSAVSLDSAFAAAGTDAEHIAFLRSLVDLTDTVQLDGALRYVDNVTRPDVDRYFELDVRLGFDLGDGLDLSLIGQNLLQESHREYRESFVRAVSGEVERGVFGKLTWRYDS